MRCHGLCGLRWCQVSLGVIILDVIFRFTLLIDLYPFSTKVSPGTILLVRIELIPAGAKKKLDIFPLVMHA
jgi:hypothetical protein